MKTIIISDINGKSESIIPYGLNLAKTIETEVDILHPVDPRTNQGEYSSLSDSKSITPGHTYSQKEIIQREKNKAQIKLDKLLSSEASRLNYPLKINTVIKEGTISEMIQEESKKSIDFIFVVNIEPDENVFLSQSEILSTAKNNKAVFILVPPETSFKNYKNVLLPINFSSASINKFIALKFFFQQFNPVVNAVDVAKKSDYVGLELKSQNWKTLLADLEIASNIRVNTLKGEDYVQTIMNYMTRNNHDLLMLLHEKQNSVRNIFKKNELEEILKRVKIPVFLRFINS